MNMSPEVLVEGQMNLDRVLPEGLRDDAARFVQALIAAGGWNGEPTSMLNGTTWVWCVGAVGSAHEELFFVTFRVVVEGTTYVVGHALRG